MSWLDPLQRRHAFGSRQTATPLVVERLETRDLLSVTATLAGGVLTVVGGPEQDFIRVWLDPTSQQLVVYDFAAEQARFAAAAVNSISVTADGPQSRVWVDNDVTQPATLRLGDGGGILQGGGGPTTLLGGAGDDKLIAGFGTTKFDGGGGQNRLLGVKPGDTVVPHATDETTLALPPAPDPGPSADQTTILNTNEVDQLIDRAAAASASDDAIIVVVDRGGRLLGVRVERGVSAQVTGNPATITYAIDGALAEARTAAFFANDQAPLTSRTIQFISQTTMTQREIESSPDVLDHNSTLYGPGFVAPIGIKGHFPPGVPFTPQVDLFDIEATNRDTTLGPGGVPRPSRFNVPVQYIPSNIPKVEWLAPPDSYGFLSGLFPNGQPRGIGTLPGGIPIYKNGVVVGGIGVFFPGTTGFATEENSSLDAKYDPSRRDRSLEAEYMAFAAVGGAPAIGAGVGTLAGIAPVAGISFPLTPNNQRIDLVGITLNIVGPGGTQGPQNLLNFGSTLGVGDPHDGKYYPVDRTGTLLKQSTPVPDGWLVTPHDGNGITAAQVTQIIQQGIAQANQTRAAIRLPLGSLTRMVFAVSDKDGNILGLYRMPDATVFSIDVAVAKARNVAYYADPAQLQAIDQLPGVPAGAAFTNRTFRFLTLPFYPEGIDGTPPGPFSILNDGGVDPNTGLNVGAPLPASAFHSIQGYDAFHPGTNFHDPNNPANQNGIVFFPGSSALYVNGVLVGGFGVSGDGVDQDDVMTVAGQNGFESPPGLRADQFFFNGVRLPYQKFDRNPQG
jgi:uncharacterized protein GlcG (DUF336 family)